MGFQLQRDQPTVQGEIEKSLTKFTGEKIRIRGASRTDSGAHAKGQVVDFLTQSANKVEQYPPGMNFYLQQDIRVQAAYRMIPEFHSRKSAHSRIYQYRIFNRQWPSPLGRHASYWVCAPLDVDRMAAAAKHLVGSHDFRALAPGFEADRSAIRTVYRWEVRREDDTVVIECEANGFLRHQIRRTNALLIEIGKGRWPGDLVNQVLDDRGSEKIEWTSAPACGLCLMKVSYPNFWSQVYTEDETD